MVLSVNNYIHAYIVYIYTCIGIGEDSFPLLMQPLLVGFDQDWSSISPSAMLAWVCAAMMIVCVCVHAMESNVRMYSNGVLTFPLLYIYRSFLPTFFYHTDFAPYCSPYYPLLLT